MIKNLKLLILILIISHTILFTEQIHKLREKTVNTSIEFSSFYKNDQRIYWSGLESTFFVEGKIKTSIKNNFNKKKFT